MEVIESIDPSLSNGYAEDKDASSQPDRWVGLKGAWPTSLGYQGGRVFDASGFKSHGTLENMSPASDWVNNGKFLLLDHDGINDVVRIDNSSGSGHPLDFLDKFSITTTIKEIPDRSGTIFGKRDGATAQYQFYTSDEAGSDWILVFRAVGVVITSDVITSIPQGRLVRVGVSIDSATNAVKFYLNGLLVSAHSVEFSLIHEAIDVSIGARWQGDPTTGFQFEGLIGDTMAYDRVLTPREFLLDALDPLGYLRLREPAPFFVPAAPSGAIPHSVFQGPFAGPFVGAF